MRTRITVTLTERDLDAIAWTYGEPPTHHLCREHIKGVIRYEMERLVVEHDATRKEER